MKRNKKMSYIYGICMTIYIGLWGMLFWKYFNIEIGIFVICLYIVYVLSKIYYKLK